MDHQNPSTSTFPQQFGPGFPFGSHRAGPRGPGAQWNFWPTDDGHSSREHRGGHHGHHGHCGRHQAGGMSGEEAREHDAASNVEREGETFQEKGDESSHSMREDAPDPAEVTPDENEDGQRSYGHGYGHGHCRRGRGRGGCGRGGRFPRHDHGHGPPQPPPGMTFDWPGMMRGFMGHPFFRNLQTQAENSQPNQTNNTTRGYHGDDDDSNTFVPPLDVFNTPSAFVLHVALPGAKKDDIGVNWNPDTSVLSIAGVVHRPGDEDFLKTLSSGERTVGLFERNITLPPAGTPEKDDVDGFAIAAKMEDGVLIVTVPKLEKEWTEIRKVDIQ